jgi:hypothetical protein
MTDDPLDRLGQAIKAGPLAVIRLRAEGLLNRIQANYPEAVSAEDLEELARVASARTANFCAASTISLTKIARAMKSRKKSRSCTN